MNRYSKIAVLLLLTGLLLLSGCARKNAGQTRIEGFAALDMPYDSGAGVMLKWKPLDKSQRIIQYNIYRGHSADSLFFLSKIEVDAKLGVASEWLNFYDKDYIPFVEFETAPAHVTKEKDQTATGTLFKAIPRDAKTVGKLLPYYDVLGDINVGKMYNHSKRIEIKDKGQKDSEIFAGYRLTQFNNLYANPKRDSTYYYCVVPVTETGRFLAATKVMAATPKNNRPDSTAVFYSTYIKDKNEMRFEWSPPLGSTDIVAWEAWLMPKSALQQFRADQRANATAPDSVFNSSWQNSSIQLSAMQPAYWAQVFYDKVNLTEAKVSIPPADKLSDYIPVLTYQDYWTSADGKHVENYQTAALGEPLNVYSSAQLPSLPHYQVMDKPNDKGDNLIISFGKPFAFVTLATYTNRSKTRMKVNYEISSNGTDNIDKLRFRFLDVNGKELGQVQENYPDKTIFLKLPKGVQISDNFIVQVQAKIVGQKDYLKDFITQRIEYDASSYRFNGGNVTFQGQLLNSIYYDIYSRNHLIPSFSPGMRIGALSRAYDHTIPFPSTSTTSILKYDPKTRLLLTDPHFTVAVNDEGTLALTPSLYKKDYTDYVKKLDKEVKDLKKKVAPGDTLSADALSLKGKQAELKYINSDPAYKAALQARSDGAWRHIFREELDKNSRSYTYKMLVTDGRALWSDQTDLPQPAKVSDKKTPETWYYPVGNLFDKTKLATLLATILMGIFVVYALIMARRREMYIRPIAGLEELDNAVGRATEMGRPVMFVPGWGSLGDVDTIASMMILNQIAKKTAEYDIRLICPNVDYFVVPLAQEMVQTAYSEMGRPDAFNQNDIFFVSDSQFAFSAAVNGITIRERVATIFFMGYFFAEALLMTETGNQYGAIQIAATDAITQVPFFITTCDYTLIGEEFYAASAYLSRNPELLGMLKSQDYFKLVIILGIIIGTILSSASVNALLNFLPFE